MIHLHQPAPDFSGTTTSGEEFRLSAQQGKPVVLFFFPKAFTPGCTKEASHFRDAYEELTSLGAKVVGISTDDRKVQCDFAAHVKAPYPMIPDPDGVIAREFDVFWPFIRLVRRVTFVIDGTGYVRAVFQHEIWVRQHVDDAVAAVKRLVGPSPEVGARL